MIKAQVKEVKHVINLWTKPRNMQIVTTKDMIRNKRNNSIGLQMQEN